jgi:two-component system, chemotaxis family, chemotaxis protein CheY
MRGRSAPLLNGNNGKPFAGTLDMASILIVDDSLSIRELLSMTLRDGGHSVEAAEDGVDGLAKARKATGHHLVITDINMPNMGGLELVGALRQLQEYKFKPILILTTESSQEMKMKGKAAGATGWLVKPFDPTKLLDVVARVLNK